MKVNKSFLFVGGIVLILNSCHFFQNIKGDGNVVTQEFPVTDYNGISVHCSSMEIEYVQSDEAPGFRLTTDRNIMDQFECYVDKDQMLMLRPKHALQKVRFSPTEFKIVAHSRGLERASLAGRSAFYLNSKLVSPQLMLNLAGNGLFHSADSMCIDQVKIDVAGNYTFEAPALFCQSLKGNVAGSGTFRLGGSVEKVSFDTAGNAEVHAFDMEMDRLNCSAVGRLQLRVLVNERIDVSVVGLQDVQYKGNASFQRKGAGGGTVHHID